MAKLRKDLFRITGRFDNTGVCIHACNGLKYEGFLQHGETGVTHFESFLNSNKDNVIHQLLVLQSFDAKLIEISKMVYDAVFPCTAEHVLEKALQLVKDNHSYTVEEAINKAKKALEY